MDLDELLNNYDAAQKTGAATPPPETTGVPEIEEVATENPEEGSTETIDVGQSTAAASSETQQKEPDSASKPVAQNDKSASAFAQMRTQISTYKKLLGKLGTMLEIDGNADENTLINALNSKIINAQAKAQNIPPEILERLEKAESASELFQAEQRRQTTLLAFQKLQTSHKLNENDLLTFAQQLDEQGKNPFEKDVDLVAEYRNLNYDKLMKKAVDEAVQAALAKATKAQTHSTKPSTQTGKIPASPDKQINTVDGLTAYLRDLKI